MDDRLKIRVEYCLGPNCKALGNWELRSLLLDYADRHNLDLELDEYHCFARCQSTEPLIPSVRINDEWLIQADWQKVKQKLQSLTG